LRLVLTADDSGADPKFDAAARTVTFGLPKAMIAKVRYSTYLDEADLRQMGVWQWIEGAGLSAAKLAELKDYATSGRHWMLTPYRVLTLVHAVKRPLVAPAFPGLQASRLLGETSASLSCVMPLNRHSTSKLNVMAAWVLPIDALDQPSWQAVPVKAEAFEVKVQPPDQPTNSYYNTHLEVRSQHEFGDTKFRRVDYTGTYTTSFPEYFDPSDGPFTRSTPQPTTLDILSSARPAAPKALYVVPTFGWEQHATGTAISSTRSSGLRVYMERPWFSSGDGELLGAVLWKPSGIVIGTPVVPDAFKPYVSRWGMDPIWKATPTPASHDIKFTNSLAQSRDGLTLDELPGKTVSVAGFAVQYDQSRRLWYCDIDIDAMGAYVPFVRLALVRFQPMSLAGAHLSRVVLADFAQLLPGRSVSITEVTGQPTQLHVVVAGASYTKGAAGFGPSKMEVQVETRPANSQDELAWVPTGPIVNMPSSAGQTWAATVTLPAPRGSQPFRLVFREHERVSQGAGLAPVLRLVFAEVLEV